MASNPCIRCGKERIVSKTWKEKANTFFGESIIIYTESICPDSECQEIVDKKIAAQKQKTEEMQQARVERIKHAQKARKRKHQS